MTQRTEATFKHDSWQEDPICTAEGLPAMSRAHCEQSYHGGLEGHGTIEYLMVYGDDGAATFTGLERFVGALAGRAGSFVLRHDGVYRDGVAHLTLQVVAGSATGELSGLRGSATFESGHADEYRLALDWQLET